MDRALGGAFDCREDAVGQSITKASRARHLLVAFGCCSRQRCCHPDDAGHIVGPGAPATFLFPAEHTRFDPHAVSDHQCAHTLGAPELVGAHRDEVGRSGGGDHVQPSHRGYRIGVEGRTGGPVTHDGRHLDDWLDGANLVVRQHHRNQAHPVVQRVGQSIDLELARSVDRHSRPSHGLTGAKHRMVLDGGAHDLTTRGGI